MCVLEKVRIKYYSEEIYSQAAASSFKQLSALLVPYKEIQPASPCQGTVLFLLEPTFTISVCGAIDDPAVKVRLEKRSKSLKWNEINPII